jgi:hypothetical protein
MDPTNEAAAGGSEPTTIAIAPAPAGETPIGARDAARTLATWRQQRLKQGATSADDPVAAQPTDPAAATQAGDPAANASEAASADKDGTGAQPDPAESDNGTQPPAIEPPKSWGKDEQELFATLPREWQGRIAERERSRDAELARHQREAAEQRRTLETDRAGLADARVRYEAALPHLLEAVLGQQANAFPDIKTMADVERLAREDQPRYLQWDLHVKRLGAMAGELAQAQTRQEAERAQQFETFAKRQDELFKEKVPEMGDPAQLANLQREAVAVLHEHGFDDAELAASWQGRKDFSLRDHRLQLVIRDAMRWREAQAKAKAAAAKPLPPVQRPGASQPKGAAQEAELDNLNRQLDKSSGVNALRAAAKLVAAKRAAR